MVTAIGRYAVVPPPGDGTPPPPPKKKITQTYVVPVLFFICRQWTDIKATLGQSIVSARKGRSLVNIGLLGLCLQSFRLAGCSFKCCSISVSLLNLLINTVSAPPVCYSHSQCSVSMWAVYAHRLRRWPNIIIIIIIIIIIFIYRGLLIELSLICHEALFKMVHNVQITYHTSIDYQ